MSKHLPSGQISYHLVKSADSLSNQRAHGPVQARTAAADPQNTAVVGTGCRPVPKTSGRSAPEQPPIRRASLVGRGGRGSDRKASMPRARPSRSRRRNTMREDVPAAHHHVAANKTPQPSEFEHKPRVSLRENLWAAPRAGARARARACAPSTCRAGLLASTDWGAGGGGGAQAAAPLAPLRTGRRNTVAKAGSAGGQAHVLHRLALPPLTSHRCLATRSSIAKSESSIRDLFSSPPSELPSRLRCPGPLSESSI